MQSELALNTKTHLDLSKTEFLLQGTPQELGKFGWLKSLNADDLFVELAGQLVTQGLFLIPLCLSLTTVCMYNCTCNLYL